jgi:hypothetical protein
VSSKMIGSIEMDGAVSATLRLGVILFTKT